MTTASCSRRVEYRVCHKKQGGAVQKGEKWLWAGVAILGATIALIAGIKLWLSQRDTPTVRVALQASCDLHRGACHSAIPDLGNIMLSITPRKIPLLRPLQIQVRIDFKDVRKLAIDFRGVDMNMGYNRFELKKSATGVYSGEAMLPVCTRTHMLWEARVLVQRTDSVVSIPYRFETGHYNK